MSEIKKDVNKTRHLSLRLDTDTFLTIERLSKEYHVSRSEVIRQALSGSSKQASSIHYVDQDQARTINKNIVSLGNELASINTNLRRIGINFNQLVKSLHMHQIQALQSNNRLLTKEELDGLIRRAERAVAKAGDVLHVFQN